MDIYQKIWDADQSESGVVPMLDTGDGDLAIGYVKVNSNLDSQDKSLRALPEVVISASKSRTYDLCRELFDNFALPERDEENDTPEEREEVHDFVHAMVDTAPMQIAREYVAQATGSSITRERWYNTLMEMWFRTFYPAFTGPAESNNGDNGNGDDPQIAAGRIKIIAALVNPKGHDPGHETVTLLNTGDALEALNGWRLEDQKGRFQSIGWIDSRCR